MNPDDFNIPVLVVDDEVIVVSLVKDALEDEGAEVLTAQDGPAALEILKENQIPLLVTDIRMSPMDGIELAQKAREINPDIVIIFMTGYANLNTAKDAIKHGAFDYIMKPFELTEIRQSVQKGINSILKKQADNNSADQLERLSDLSQMLYEVGDAKSLVAISMKFAIMQLGGLAGNIMYWSREHKSIKILHGNVSAMTESSLDEASSAILFDHVDFGRWNQPRDLENYQEHPLYSYCEKVNCTDMMFPELFQREGIQLVTLPIRRADAVFGVLTVAIDTQKTILKKTELQLLSITSSQLALSLENLFLLDETQIAYSQLKRLQDETIQLEKMATRGEISAEIGHELNNFLGVVSGNLQLLELHWSKGKYDLLGKYVEVMNTNIDKIKKFTDNLMDLGRIASVPEILSFNKLLAEVLDYLKPQGRYNGVTISLHPADTEISFKADSTHIQQLLYNLMNNAADATKDRPERRIDVAVTTNPDENSFTLSIKDTGSGIDPKLLEKAFKEKFTTKPNGHGFGLLVCSRIIASHGGKLEVDSTPDVGTIIQVTFPVANVAEPEPVA
ncbi:MAG: response regulator [bacterium]|nr:response regulator [bacterium]